MKLNETLLYTAKTHTIGGRNGRAVSSDRRLEIDLSVPGSNGIGTNPEQLLAAGWSACFIGAITRAAGLMGVQLPDEASVTAEIDLIITAGDEYSLQARLSAHLPGLDLAIAQAIVDRAHDLCPFSKATRGNIKTVMTAA